MIGRTVGHYQVVEPLGAGGMGEVWRARDLRLQRDVALKALPEEVAGDPERRARFAREARAVAVLNDPHIAAIHGVEEVDGRSYLILECVEGETLAERLARGPLPQDVALAVGLQLAAGLETAHAAGVVHRDLKPANLKLTPEGRLKILDFGLAKIAPEVAAAELSQSPTLSWAATQAGVLLGTAAYMSPEQATGKEVDKRADVWAFGCVLYECLTGRRPFGGATVTDVLASILKEEPDWERLPAATPRAVRRLLRRCLAKDPARRLRDIGDARIELEDAVGEQSPEVEASPGRERRGVGRLPLWSLAITALIAVALAAAAWWSTTRELPSPRITSLAVLPLNNLMGDPEQDYFVEGMHEALTAELAKISALKVISRTSAMRYRDTDKTMRQIARELDVTGLIEGSVLREGDHVRIVVQLIHGPTDRHLWADSFDREIRGILSLYSDVARAVAGEIEVALTPEEEGILVAARPLDPAAYEDYLRGQYEWNKLNREGWEAAIGWLERSIERDPSYAPAWAMASLAHSLLSYYSRHPRDELHERAAVAAERAVELDRSLAEAHAALAMVKQSFDWDWATADQASREGLRLNPASPMALYARSFFSSFMGRHEEAIGLARRAVELDPVAPHVNTWLTMFYFMARRYDDAVEQAHRVLALEPDFFDARLWLCYTYAKQGLHEEAARESARIKPILPLGRDWLDVWLLSLAGQGTEASRMLDRIETTGHPTAAYFLAISLGELGEIDRAFALLEQAYAGRSTLMAVLKVDPRIDALRDDPRFDDLLRRMRFPL